MPPHADAFGIRFGDGWKRVHQVDDIDDLTGIKQTFARVRATPGAIIGRDREIAFAVQKLGGAVGAIAGGVNIARKESVIHHDDRKWRLANCRDLQNAGDGQAIALVFDGIADKVDRFQQRFTDDDLSALEFMFAQTCDGVRLDRCCHRAGRSRLGSFCWRGRWRDDGDDQFRLCGLSSRLTCGDDQSKE